MSKINFKQLKLTNGDEIICDYIEDDHTSGIAIVRAAMKIIEVEDLDQGYSYFAFRPFMSFTEDNDKLLTINMQHIIGETNPSSNLLKHYAVTLTKMDKFLTTGKTMEEAEMLEDDEFERIMSDLDELEESETPKEKDDRGPNIIKFKPKTDTFH